jgi:hypothetical protein
MRVCCAACAPLSRVLDLSEAWAPAHGGQLRLFPFPLGACDVAPRVGRLAMFCSTTMLHRVLPAHAPRCVLSLWFAGAPAPFPTRYPAWLAAAAAGSAAGASTDAGAAGDNASGGTAVPTPPAAPPPSASPVSAGVLAFLRRPANARVLCKARNKHKRHRIRCISHA